MEEVTFHTRIDMRGKSPQKMVYIRPYYRRKRYPHVSTRVKTTKEIYDDFIDGRVNTRSPAARSFATAMEEVMERARGAVPTPFSYQIWKDQFTGIYDADSFAAAFEQKISSVSAKKTKDTYRYALKKFLSYDPHIDLRHITPDDLYRIEEWMEADGLAWSTIGIYMRCLRAVYNHLRRRQSIDHYPFREYKPPVSQNIKKALLPDEIQTLLEFDSPDYYDQRAVDFWKICYLMFGKYPSDLKNLKKSQIQGDRIIFTHRAKTSRTRHRKEYVVPITPALDDLLLTWSNGTGEHVFDFGNFHSWKSRINGRLVRIGEEEGFRIKLTLQTARHSAASKLLHAGASIDHIQDILMHQNRQTSENYLDSFSTDYVDEFARKLIE